MKIQLAAYQSLTESHYKQVARQLGIDVHEHEGRYLYVHTRAGTVAHEGELDQSLSRQVLAQLFAAKIERLAISQQVSGEVTTSVTSRKRPVKRVADIIEQPATRITKEAPVKPPDNCALDKPALRIENAERLPTGESLVSRPDRPLKKRRKNRPRL